MFGWMNSLFTVLVAPFVLFLGTYQRSGSLGSFLPKKMRGRFPVSEKTTFVMEFSARPCVARKMRQNNVAGFAFLGFMFYDPEEYVSYAHIRGHEAIHILQQSLVSPPLFAVYWGLSLIMYAPFAKYYTPHTWRTIPLHEYIAYSLDDAEWNDELLTNRRLHDTR